MSSEVEVVGSGGGGSDKSGPTLSAAARARMERNRLRARALQEARLVRRPKSDAVGVVKSVAATIPLDSGGGFLLEEPAAEPAPLARPSAPLVHRADQPECEQCARRFPQSFLFDTFGHRVCDECRDDEGEHALIARTEARAEFLLQECDLDSRPPPLRCLRRRNPHRPGGADMRLYLRAQVEERALLVWGSRAALEEARAARTRKREEARHKQARRRLHALRMDVRSSLYDRSRDHHQHRWGEETHDAAADVYERACLDCGHVQTYEKM